MRAVVSSCEAATPDGRLSEQSTTSPAITVARRRRLAGITIRA